MREALTAVLPRSADTGRGRRPPTRAGGGEGLAPYLLVAPLALVFLLFFVVPLLLVVVVSFFDYEAYDMLIPAFTFQNYIDVFSRAGRPGDTYLSTLKFCLLVWLITLVLGFAVAYFLAFHVRSLSCADDAVPAVHDPVLDLQRDPHDLLDAAARAATAWSTSAAVAGPRRPAAGVAAVFRLLGGAGLRPPLHAVHDRADLQLDDAHRPVADRGRDATPAPPSWQTIWHVILPLVQARHRHRLDLRHHHRHGRLRHRRRDGRQQIASIGKIIVTELSYLQFPPAAANAMVLLATVILMIVAPDKLVDIRKEL